MSNSDLLTIEESKVAASQGWQLFHVYDRGRWSIKVLSTNPAVRNAESASQIVIAHARAGSVLHQKAISLVLGR
jgi:hypothetical protein